MAYIFNIIVSVLLILFIIGSAAYLGQWFLFEVLFTLLIGG